MGNHLMNGGNPPKGTLTQTMLITLWARAVEAQQPEPILRDPNAGRILSELGYGLDLYDARRQNGSQVGSCIRARWIDERVEEWIAQHAGGQVIQLGAGVDDRFRRLGQPEAVARWYDLDLEDVCSVRQTVVAPCERCEVQAESMFDTGWMERLAQTGRPTLIIIEGVLMYFTEQQVRELFACMAARLPGATVLFDSVPKSIVKKAKRHDTLREFEGKVDFLWGIQRPEEIEQLHARIRLVRGELMGALPWARRFRGIYRLLIATRFGRRRFSQLLLEVVLE